MTESKALDLSNKFKCKGCCLVSLCAEIPLTDGMTWTCCVVDLDARKPCCEVCMGGWQKKSILGGICDMFLMFLLSIAARMQE